MEYLGIYGPVSLPTLLERYPRHKGTPIVRACLARLADDPGGRVRSDLEEAFLPFLDAHQIPRPRLNAWISIDDDRFQVDCLCPTRSSSASSTASSPTARSEPSARTAGGIGGSERVDSMWFGSLKISSWGKRMKWLPTSEC
jgi:hypothetical protein